VKQRAIAGGRIAVQRGEVSVTSGGLPIACGGGAVGVRVVRDTCLAVSMGNEIAYLRPVVTSSRNPVSLHGCKLTFVSGCDRLGYRPSVPARGVAKTPREAGGFDA
jgi:hypothetical protein